MEDEDQDNIIRFFFEDGYQYVFQKQEYEAIKKYLTIIADIESEVINIPRSHYGFNVMISMLKNPKLMRRSIFKNTLFSTTYDFYFFLEMCIYYGCDIILEHLFDYVDYNMNNSNIINPLVIMYLSEYFENKIPEDTCQNASRKIRAYHTQDVRTFLIPDAIRISTKLIGILPITPEMLESEFWTDLQRKAQNEKVYVHIEKDMYDHTVGKLVNPYLHVKVYLNAVEMWYNDIDNLKKKFELKLHENSTYTYGWFSSKKDGYNDGFVVVQSNQFVYKIIFDRLRLKRDHGKLVCYDSPPSIQIVEIEGGGEDMYGGGVCAYQDDIIYVIDCCWKCVRKIDLKKKTNTTIASLQNNRKSPSIFLHGKRLYIYGEMSWSFKNELCEYYPLDLKHWTPMNLENLPIAEDEYVRIVDFEYVNDSTFLCVLTTLTQTICCTYDTVVDSVIRINNIFDHSNRTIQSVSYV